MPVAAFTDGTARAWVGDVRRRISTLAEAEALTMRDFASTLLFGLLDDRTSAFVQIGDGAIVALQHDEYSPVFWPQIGEYANSTYFVTDEEALSTIEFAASSRLEEVALLTDGLQNLALRFDTHTAHAPFFTPMFRHLRRQEQTESAELLEALAEFLNSSAVNARSDDDKTLVLATRLPGEP